MQTMVVSNIRFPQNDWIMLKTVAAGHDMSVNEYLQYIVRIQTVKDMTGIKRNKPKKNPYKAMDDFIEFTRTHKNKPMGASEEDKIIYGID